MYIRRTWRAGVTVEVKKTYSARYGRRLPRSSNQGRTSERQERENERRAVAELRRLLNANFKPGDHHAIFTYPMAYAPTAAEAKADRDRLLRLLRPLYRAAGMELKYITVTEYTHKRIHHHVVLPDLHGDMRPVKAVWKRVLAEKYYTPAERERGEPLHLRFPWSPLDDSGQYGELAEYLIKETAKSRKEPGAVCKRRYAASRNLVHPQPVVEIIDAKTWRKEAAQRRGYYIDKRVSFNEVSEETGMAVQETVYVEIRPRSPWAISRR